MVFVRSNVLSLVLFLVWIMSTFSDRWPPFTVCVSLMHSHEADLCCGYFAVSSIRPEIACKLEDFECRK